MPRYAIIQSNTVINTVEWDGNLATWQPPAGTITIQSDTAGIRDTWDGTTFTKVPPLSPDPRELTTARISELSDKPTRTAAETKELLDIVARRLIGRG